MKILFLVISLLFASFFFISCEDSDDGVVKLNGPILETIRGDGSIEFNGAVINTADYPVESVYVRILLENSSGEVIEEDGVFVTSSENSDGILEPSESAMFSILFEVNAAEVFSKDVKIYYDW